MYSFKVGNRPTLICMGLTLRAELKFRKASRNRRELVIIIQFHISFFAVLNGSCALPHLSLKFPLLGCSFSSSFIRKQKDSEEKLWATFLHASSWSIYINFIWAFPPYLKTKVSYSLDYVYIASPALLLSIAPLDESRYTGRNSL